MICACGRRCSPTAKRCWSCHAGKAMGGAHPLKRSPQSLRALANAAGCSYSTIKKAAAGMPVSRSTAKRIAEVSGVDVRLLILGRGLIT